LLQNRGINFNTQNLKKEYDYIIVGQGLAGSCLALELIEEGKRVIVFSEPKGKTASRVAAGLINPITGRKMKLTWKAKELFSFLENFYR
jgi:glycine/D-amino acid oxidase-like deaminating enzyme